MRQHSTRFEPKPQSAFGGVMPREEHGHTIVRPHGARWKSAPTIIGWAAEGFIPAAGLRVVADIYEPPIAQGAPRGRVYLFERDREAAALTFECNGVVGDALCLYRALVRTYEEAYHEGRADAEARVSGTPAG